MSKAILSKIVNFSLILTLCLLMLGSFTRLMNAGLGCPDWPGCYGQLVAPSATDETISQAFPNKPVETQKAWIEMIHRYVAGVLGLLIFVIVIVAVKIQANKQIIKLSIILLFTVIFQALLGMWTVTMLVYPAIVTAHLLGGMLTISLLWLVHLNLKIPKPKTKTPLFLSLGVIVIFIQISLGGWVSTNYAALACPAFPQCYFEQLLPSMDLIVAFDVRMVEGLNYEGGILSADTRATIQMIHRLGALLVGIYLLIVALVFIQKPNPAIKTAAWVLLLVLIGQISLGIANVYFLLPLPLAVLHNGGAALLLLSMLSLRHLAKTF